MVRLLQEQGVPATYEEVAGKEHWWWDTTSDNDGGVLNDATLRQLYDKLLSRPSSSSSSALVTDRTWREERDGAEAEGTKTGKTTQKKGRRKTKGRKISNRHRAETGLHYDGTSRKRASLDDVELKLINPAASSGKAGVQVLQQQLPYRLSKVRVVRLRGRGAEGDDVGEDGEVNSGGDSLDALELATSNVLRLRLHLHPREVRALGKRERGPATEATASVRVSPSGEQQHQGDENRGGGGGGDGESGAQQQWFVLRGGALRVDGMSVLHLRALTIPATRVSSLRLFPSHPSLRRLGDDGGGGSSEGGEMIAPLVFDLCLVDATSSTSNASPSSGVASNAVQWASCVDEGTDLKSPSAINSFEGRERGPNTYGPARQVVARPFAIVVGSGRRDGSSSSSSSSSTRSSDTGDDGEDGGGSREQGQEEEEEEAEERRFMLDAALYIANIHHTSTSSLAPVVMDTDLSEDDAASLQLILIGDPSVNVWTKRVVEELGHLTTMGNTTHRSRHVSFFANGKGGEDGDDGDNGGDGDDGGDSDDGDDDYDSYHRAAKGFSLGESCRFDEKGQGVLALGARAGHDGVAMPWMILAGNDLRGLRNIMQVRQPRYIICIRCTIGSELFTLTYSSTKSFNSHCHLAPDTGTHTKLRYNFFFRSWLDRPFPR